MSVGVEDEAPRDASQRGPGFSDAVTFAFGDLAAQVYGLARVGLAGGQGSGLAIVFSGTDPVSVSAEGNVDVESGGWEAVQAADITTRTITPLEEWAVDFDGDGASFDLHFAARSAPAVLDAAQPAAQIGGMEGYEQLCRVTGEAKVDGRSVRIDCLGQRGHTWGEPDWEHISVARTITAWMDDERSIALSSVRPSDAEHHLDEAVAAFYVEGGEPVWVADPRLSTGYDGAEHQRRAGMELWVTDEAEYAHRISGQVIAGTTLDLGRLRLDCAFFGWRMEGRTGVGRYDILRRVDAPAEPVEGEATA